MKSSEEPTTAPQRKIHPVAIAAGLTVIVIVMLWANTYWRQYKQFHIGEVCYRQGEYMEAMVAYESAIHMYTPWSSMIPKSAQRMWDLAEDFRQKEEYHKALVTLRSLRSSFYAVRSFYQPYPQWIERCDEAIAELVPLKERQNRDRLEKKGISQSPMQPK